MDGVETYVDTVFVRGSKIQFIVLPSMLKNAPFFSRIKMWRKFKGNAVFGATAQKASAGGNIGEHSANMMQKQGGGGFGGDRGDRQGNNNFRGGSGGGGGNDRNRGGNIYGPGSSDSGSHYGGGGEYGGRR